MTLVPFDLSPEESSPRGLCSRALDDWRGARRAGLAAWLRTCARDSRGACRRVLMELGRAGTTATHQAGEIEAAHRRLFARLLFAAAELELHANVETCWIPGRFEGERWGLDPFVSDPVDASTLGPAKELGLVAGFDLSGAGSVVSAGLGLAGQIEDPTQGRSGALTHARSGGLTHARSLALTRRRWGRRAWRAIWCAFVDGYRPAEVEVLVGLLACDGGGAGVREGSGTEPSRLAACGLGLVDVARGRRLLGYALLFEGCGQRAWRTFAAAAGGGRRDRELALLGLTRRHEWCGVWHLAGAAARAACAGPDASAASGMECMALGARSGEEADVRLGLEVLRREERRAAPDRAVVASAIVHRLDRARSSGPVRRGRGAQGVRPPATRPRAAWGLPLLARETRPLLIDVAQGSDAAAELACGLLEIDGGCA